MQTLAHSIWWPRGASFVLAALAAGSASFWALRVSAVNMSTSVTPAAMSGAIEIDTMAVTRALGGGPAPTAAPVASLSSRFVMVGVVADQSSTGAALIAIDGRPAKPFRVGDLVEEGLILQSVRGRTAALGPAMGAAPAVSLELPPLKQ